MLGRICALSTGPRGFVFVIVPACALWLLASLGAGSASANVAPSDEARWAAADQPSDPPAAPDEVDVPAEDVPGEPPADPSIDTNAPDESGPIAPGGEPLVPPRQPPQDLIPE